MNEIKVFNHDQFGTLRELTIDGNPWFVGKDVAEALSYTNPQKAIRDHVDTEDRTVNESFTVNGTMGTLINESGLYSLIMSSKLPTAKHFKHWVTSEVLPTIRKHGVYMTDQKAFDITHSKDALADLMIQAANQLKQKDLVIQELKPKALFADAVSTSKTSILIGDLAKLICQNGVNIGQKRLFDWLRENGYLIRYGSSKNMPQQRYVEQGLFEIKESNVQNPDGSVRITKTTKVTGKGQIYFVNKFLQKE